MLNNFIVVMFYENQYPISEVLRSRICLEPCHSWRRYTANPRIKMYFAVY
jgi:hypothetical protein